MKEPKVFFSHDMREDEGENRAFKEGYLDFFRTLLKKMFGKKNVLEAKNSSGHTIGDATFEQIKGCDLMYALFSGREPLKKEGCWCAPSGVVFETGYAGAKGISVIGAVEKGVKEIGMIRYESPLNKTTITNILSFDSLEDLKVRRKTFKENIQKVKDAIIKEGEVGLHCLNASCEAVIYKNGYTICRFSRRFLVKYSDDVFPFTHKFDTEKTDCTFPAFEKMSSCNPQEAYKNGDFFFAKSMVKGKFNLNVDDIKIDETRTKFNFKITILGQFAKDDEFEYEYVIGIPNLSLTSLEQQSGFELPHVAVDRAVLTLSFEKGMDNFLKEPIFALFSYDKRMRQETERVFDKRFGALYTSYTKEELDIPPFGAKLVAAWKSK